MKNILKGVLATIVVVSLYFVLDSCKEDSCPNGEVCRKDGFGFVCELAEAELAEAELAELAEAPTDDAIDGGPSLCEPGYYGIDCEESVCDDYVCGGNGDCIITINGTADCDCEKGFGGFYCEIDQRSCDDVNGNCANGYCEDGVCICNDSYVGTTCEYPCFGNGQINSAGECVCEHGFVGTQCEFEDCNNQSRNHVEKKCLHGGTCYDTNPDDWRDGVNPFVCDCPPFYRGQRCQEYFCIDTTDCFNDGVCSEDFGCDCPDGFTGDQCEIED